MVVKAAAGAVYRRAKAVLAGSPPVISSPVVTDNGDGSFTFTWTTNISSTSRIEFGLDATPPDYAFYQEDPTLVTSHSITLTSADGLVAGSIYDWRMVSSSALGNTTYGTTGASTAGTITVPTGAGTVSLSSNGWISNLSGAPAASLTMAFTNTPIAGSLVFATAEIGGITNATFTDDIGDSGGSRTEWADITGSPWSWVAYANNVYVQWRVIGNAPSGKTITVTPAASKAMNIAAANYEKTAGTWGIDGSVVQQQTTGTNPTPGTAITTTVASAAVIGIADAASGSLTAGAGYTTRVDRFAYLNLRAEDRITTVAGTYTPNWTAASQDYRAIGVAFKAA